MSFSRSEDRAARRRIQKEVDQLIREEAFDALLQRCEVQDDSPNEFHQIDEDISPCQSHQADLKSSDKVWEDNCNHKLHDHSFHQPECEEGANSALGSNFSGACSMLSCRNAFTYQDYEDYSAEGHVETVDIMDSVLSIENNEVERTCSDEDVHFEEVDGFCGDVTPRNDFLDNTTEEDESVQNDGVFHRDEHLSTLVTDNEPSLSAELALWAVHNNITHTAVDKLLCLLRKYNHPELPKSAKTLLQTPRNTEVNIKEVAGGKFWYYGFLKGLMTKLTPYYVNNYVQNKTVFTDIFADGISPYKSSSVIAWPLIGCLSNQNEPYIIAMWCGRTKEPTNLQDFLCDFVHEAKVLLQEGFEFNGTHFKLVIRNYIADAPARAWLRRVNQHGSIVSCERCEAEGEWVDSRVTFNPKKRARLRTDESFQQRSQPNYHKGESPLEALGTKMISQFPLDSMHLIYLGVFKRFLQFLLLPKISSYKLKPAFVEELSEVLVSFSEYLPSEFERRPRSLKEWHKYKATELRRILLYDGMILFAKLRPELYQLYLLLSCGIRILNDHLLVECTDDAHHLLEKFVDFGFDLFGQKFVVYNVHHLLHLASDCKLHGSLDSFCAFKYENAIGKLKHMLHAPGRTLSQIACRMMEKVAVISQHTVPTMSVSLHQIHNNGPLINDLHSEAEQYKKLVSESMVLRVYSQNDCCCMSEDGELLIVENILKSQGEIYVIGKPFESKLNYFTYPVPSSSLNVFAVQTLGPMKMWHFDKIAIKCVLLPLHSDADEAIHWNNFKGLCIPMLHYAK